MEPSASLRLVKPRWYLSTKFCMAPVSERAATPTNVTPGLAAATALTEGASALQNGHHGVQNHSTAGLPARLEPLNGWPARVVPVNCWRSSASAVGGLPSTRAAIPATIARTNHPRSRNLAADMASSPFVGGRARRHRIALEQPSVTRIG